MIKKHFFVLLVALATFPFFSCISNENKVWVLDGEHVLTHAQIKSLDSLYKTHEKITTNEIALVTTPDYGTDTSMLFFAVTFGRRYGVGKKDKNNGVIIAYSKAMHQTSIATGYGTEKILTDQIAKKIIDSVMIPLFKQAKIFEGLWQGSKAIITFLEKPDNKIMPLKNK